MVSIALSGSAKLYKRGKFCFKIYLQQSDHINASGSTSPRPKRQESTDATTMVSSKLELFPSRDLSCFLCLGLSSCRHRRETQNQTWSPLSRHLYFWKGGHISAITVRNGRRVGRVSVQNTGSDDNLAPSIRLAACLQCRLAEAAEKHRLE